LVRQGQDPAAVVVQLPGRWVLLSETGEYVDVPVVAP
jgi:hypothetical protein